MAKVAYTHTGRNVGPGNGKYPFKQLREIGDYFDAPIAARAGLQNAAYCYGRLKGYRIKVTTLSLTTGDVRAILVEIEEGAVHAR